MTTSRQYVFQQGAVLVHNQIASLFPHYLHGTHEKSRRSQHKAQPVFELVPSANGTA